VGVSLTPFLVAWRTTPLHDREVVDALVDPAHAQPSAALAEALRQWPGSYYWSNEPDGRHLVLTRPHERRREVWGLHLVLLLAVLVTTTVTGAIVAGTIPAHLGAWRGPDFLARLSHGLLFSVPLLAILFTHEMGHYVTSRRYQVDASPPFFLPGFPPPFGIGTFGAFIRLRTIVSDRRQLLDIGAAGPIAGFLVALPILWIGLQYSHPMPAEDVHGMVVRLGDEFAYPLGDSIVTLLLRRLVPGSSGDIVLHPTAFAGWFGMFVTMLNLLPMAQLDGGHIIYAATPRLHQPIARAFWLIVMVLGWFWFGWWLWGAIVLTLSRGQLRHPPVLDAYRPLPRSRSWLLLLSLVLFLLTFSPAPFRTP
jgi:membrane-associated protease RseP (regulator of RpoE activity)